MTKKKYTLENLGCANCAAKMEQKINDLPQVEQAVITFATRVLSVTAEDPDALLPQLQQIVSGIEGDAKIVPYCRERAKAHSRHEHDEQCHCGHQHHHDHEEHCGCGHHHEHGEHCACGHGQDHHEDHDGHHHGGENDLPRLLAGVGLFALGLILGAVELKWVSLAAYVAAYLVLGLPILKEAVQNMTKGHVFDENFLMSIATIGAFAIGEYPEAVGVMLFFRVGEYFEEKAVERSRSQIMEAIDLRPERVNRMDGDTVTEIDPEDARVGDLLLVRPGDRIPLDAVVVTGESQIDTAPITGEPVPVTVRPGDQVVSGCVNTSGQLTIRVEKPLQESMVTRILEAVETAAAGKPKIDRFITRFARVYTPIVVAAAAITAIVPSLITGQWSYWVYTALSFLVMSCPCALVLSVPLAFFCGIGAGSRQGILFKGGLSMEAMGDVKVVALDKTGTITRGDFTLRRAEGEDGLLQLCASCEQHSTHPVAKSIVTAAREQGLHLHAPQELEEIPGHGIKAVLDGHTVLCGNEGLLQKFGVSVPEMDEEMGTRVLVARDGMYIGCLLVADTIKSGAKATVEALHKRGITTVMLTGDSRDSARLVAEKVGISTVFPKLLPQEKLQKLQQLRKDFGKVMFVGDGINDAPVLAGSDVGAAMGSGADAAIEAADVVFLTADVQAVARSLDIASRTRQIAWQNVVFALAVKAVVMVLGLAGYASMWLAVFADSGVAMLCVLNAMRVLYRSKS